MKFLKHVLTFVITIAVLTACKNNKQPEIKTVETATPAVNTVKKQLNPNATYAKTEFNIAGMTCPKGCAKKIEGSLTQLEGVKSATVDFDRQLAMVEYDVAKVTPEHLTTAVTTASEKFKVSDIKHVDAFSTKKCPSGCAKACCKDKESCNCKEGCKGKCGTKGVTCTCKNCRCKGCSGAKSTCSKECKKACCTNKMSETKA